MQVRKSARLEEQSQNREQGALFVFRMAGIHDNLASSADCDAIAARERERYPEYDEATVQRIQDQMPMLFNDEKCLVPAASLGCRFI